MREKNFFLDPFLDDVAEDAFEEVLVPGFISWSTLFTVSTSTSNVNIFIEIQPWRQITRL